MVNFGGATENDRKKIVITKDSKDKKLTGLVPKVTPEEFLDNLVEGEINTFLIIKEK